MTTLTMPSLERRLLQTVKEEVEAKSVRDWPQESVEVSLVLLQQFRERIAGMRKELEKLLAEGVESRSFVRDGAQVMSAAEDRSASIQDFIEKLSSSEDAASTRLLESLRSLEKEEKAFRDIVTEALDRVSRPSPSIDWDRLEKEADADFAAGRFVRFETEKEMFEGLAGND